MNLTRHKPPLREAIVQWYPHLNALITLTESDAVDYRDLLGPAARVLSIPNAAPATDAIRAQPGDDNRVVVAAGRLTRQKGFDRLVVAWAGVQEKHPDWRLDIFGHGDRAALQARVDEQGVTGTVRVRGFTSDLRQRFAESSIFVLSSRAEGFPMVLLEAMSCGLPLVSFDCRTGPSQLIRSGHNGLLVPDGDLQGLTDALITLMEAPDARRRMGAEGLRMVRQYTPDRIAAHWEQLFRELDRAPRHRLIGAHGEATALPRRLWFGGTKATMNLPDTQPKPC